MTNTKDKVADAAASARPYVERAIRDKELRDNVRNAYTSARAVYDELSSRRRMSDAATRLGSAGDERAGDRAGEQPQEDPGDHSHECRILALALARARVVAQIPEHVAGGAHPCVDR